MAAFTTFQEAEIRAKLRMGDGTWVVAHAERMFNGTIAVRVIRPMTTAGFSPPPVQGSWVDITDNVVN
jgi:hypothetical protein